MWKWNTQQTWRLQNMGVGFQPRVIRWTLTNIFATAVTCSTSTTSWTAPPQSWAWQLKGRRKWVELHILGFIWAPCSQASVGTWKISVSTRSIITTREEQKLGIHSIPPTRQFNRQKTRARHIFQIASLACVFGICVISRSCQWNTLNTSN